MAGRPLPTPAPVALGSLLLGLLLVSSVPAAGQADSLRSSITRKLARYEQRGPLEKLFLHLDRPAYLCGETMWFKVYAADGTLGRPLALSSIAYVEVLDARNRPVLQAKVPLRQATGQGSFIVPATLGSGTYTVRAYTSWMRNDDPQGYFHTTITVLNTTVASGPAARQDSVAFDAQFFPEGGNLVQGLPSKVGFKVLNQWGQGVAATGQVLNTAGQVVAQLSTLRAGMGSFSLTPDAGPYTAVLTLGGGQRLTRKLPAAYAQGYVLHLGPASATYLTLEVAATGQASQAVFLLAHARQQQVMAQQAQLVNGRAMFTIAKSQLPEGVSHFTLFTGSQQPVCDRLYFQPPAHPLALRARPDQPAYPLRSQVSVQVTVPDQPAAARASASVAVYRLDSLSTADAPTIAQYLWLTSELKGRVENPGQYFAEASPAGTAATDNLLLTQGWSRIRWEDVLAPTLPPLRYLPELNGLLVRGQLTRAGTGQPRPGTLAYLAAPSRTIRLSNALSDDQGVVQFETTGFYGPRTLMAQTNPQQDSTSRLTLLSPFSERFASWPAPPLHVLPRLGPTYARRHLQNQLQNSYFASYRNRYAALPADSLAFYGPPDETYFLDKYTRFKVLEEVLREYVPGVLVKIRKDGYHLMVVDLSNKKSFAAFKENPLVLVDGVPFFNINKVMAINPLKLRKLEVIDNRYVHGPALYNGIVSFTTYQGDLGGIVPDANVLVQQYEGVQRQREFYAPRYETPAEKQSRLPDLRNLLYWQPELPLTGANAQAISFYTGDQAGRYRVVVQGLNTDGQAGSTSFTLEVKPAL